MQDASTVVIEPLNLTVVILGCAGLPEVCTSVLNVSRVPVVNNSYKPIKMLTGFPFVSVNTKRPASKLSQATATAPRLPHESKLRKVLHELKIDSLSDTAPPKQQLLCWCPSISIFMPSAT